MTKLAEQFSNIFSGLARSSGRYVVPDDAVPDAKGKVLGRAWTSHEPITLELWEAHLSSNKKLTVTNEENGEPITGALSLGIVPIREDASAVFGAIDIDVYPLDLEALRKRIEVLGLPLITVRSKSGGAHLYLFLSEPASAELVRDRLAEWAVALNYPGVEIFPKQALLSAHADGSWINIPYSGGDRSVRYALRPDGKAMKVAEFVEAVGALAITPTELEEFELPAEETGGEDWEGSPPCLSTLARIGFGDWQNNGLFNVAVYLKKRYGEGWEGHLSEYNQKYMAPPLGNSAMAAIIKSVKKRTYFYKCKDQPIAPVCNKAVCLKCSFGIGGDSGDSGVILGELTKVLTEPVLWILPVNGKDLELASSDLTDQRKFRHAAIEKLSIWPNLVKPEDWAKEIKDRLARATVSEAPEDGTREGQLWEHLANFCTGRSRARNADEILMGKAYTDVKAGKAWFRSTDFFAYLAAHRFSIAEREVWRFLRRKGAEHTGKNLKGKFVNVWAVTAFPEQTEEHSVPRAAPKAEM